MYRILLILLSITLLWLQYRLWWGAGSLREIKLLQSQTLQVEKSLAVDHARNLKLRKDIDNLKQGGDILEEIAREQLGLIASDEHFFRVIQHKPVQNKAIQNKPVQ